MAQPFDCLCGKPTCRGRISGARDMTQAQLEGIWLNGHIHELLGEESRRNADLSKESDPENGSSTVAADPAIKGVPIQDATSQALRDTLNHAEKVVEAARNALQSYLSSAILASHTTGENRKTNGNTATNGVTKSGVADTALVAGLTRRGATSRELSGEMGGDTIVV